MHEAILVMISCEDKSQAERIGEQLLKNKLAACTQIVSHADSMFLWPPRKNQIDYADEALLLVKTLDEKWPKLEREVLRLHTYENPEIIAIPLLRVTKRYLVWLKSELS